MITKHRVPCRQFETERLLLRCPSAKDGEALYTAVLNSVDHLKPWFAWITDQAWTPEISKATARYAGYRFINGVEFEFYLFLKREDRFVGICGLCDPDWSIPQFELRYWLRSGCEGRGFMREAVAAAIEVATHDLGAKQLEIHCDPMNTNSIALAKSLDFHEVKSVASEIVLIHRIG